uniref:HMG box domain-containing protein n=1 Tax=Amphora coffeiformis TaxID=265554 RepID=A0A7S3L7X1_9STRA|mmetsp:Transcript_550/g.1021  ORF Transcript_550/g.1021 Transcript_550/m.1021 type:complete len:416 (+) Transcript_550:155-1402(+)
MIATMSGEKEGIMAEAPAESEVKAATSSESKDSPEKKDPEKSSKEEAKQEDASTKQVDTSNKEREANKDREASKEEETPVASPGKRRATDVKHRRKKPRDAPRRPLSAYNIYFRNERAELVARNEEGNPDKDFEVNLDAVVATGKKRDDPSSIFQAAARTLATRWKKMPAADKAEYEEQAEEEMKRYRARVYEYETRMVEEARQKSGPNDMKSSSPKKKPMETESRSNREIGNESQGSHSQRGENISAYSYPPQPQLWTGAPGVPPSGYTSGLGYTLMQPGMMAFPPHHTIHPGFTFSGGLPAIPNEALFHLMQAQAPGGSYITSYPTHAFPPQAPSGAPHGEWRGEPSSYQDPIISALQREHVFQDQLNAARAANAPVAFTILPPGSANHQMLRQMLDRREGEGSSRGAPPGQK